MNDVSATRPGDSPAPCPDHASGDAVHAHGDHDLFTLLSNDSIIHVEGADAADYLHSQFSSDIRSAAPGSSFLTSYSDPRGRLLAVMRVLALAENEFVLILDRSVLPQIIAQLRKYALRARVNVAESAWSLAGVAGRAAGERLVSAGFEIAAYDGEQAWSIGGMLSVRLPDSLPRWLLIGPQPSLAHAASALTPWAASDNAPAWLCRDIELGLPRITAATSSRFVAQMVNLDRLAALDFRKGCYPGQEVVARTHYLGRIKRRMFIVDTPRAAVPAPGDSIHDAAGKAIGEIVMGAEHGDGSIALAVLRTDAATGELHVGTADGPLGHAREPAYGLADAV